MAMSMVSFSSYPTLFFVFGFANVYFMETPIKQKRRNPLNRNKKTQLKKEKKRN